MVIRAVTEKTKTHELGIGGVTRTDESELPTLSKLQALCG